MIKLVLLLALVFTENLQCLAQNSRCKNSNSEGKCTPLEDCAPAIEAIKKYRRHEFSRCGFDHFTEIVCCPDPVEDTSLRHPEIDDFTKIEEACVQFNKLPILLSYHIVNGENAAEKEFPHMAALGFYSVEEKLYLFDCGGTLISNQYVVTAAHCVINVQKNELKIIRLGVVQVPASVDEPNPKMDYNVANITVHKDYNWKEKFNDIALIKLEKTVSFNDFIRPACLYTKNDDPAKLIVTGWGAVSLGGDRSNILQKAVLTPRSLTECNSTYSARTKRIVLRSQICAADTRSDACQGDSGGPIQIQGNGSVATLVGVTSYGIGCGSKYPGIYTRVYSYLSWIQKRVWP